ncbi:MAG: hydroxyisourate hydrolase [Pseudomonadota bacterium]
MNKRSPITTHILDVSLGKPASGVSCKLEKLENSNSWTEMGTGTTNPDGRVENLMDGSLSKGIYRIEFATKPYFEQKNTRSFYPSVVVTFEVFNEQEHYHVPLLLSPFGFSTYRGS